MRHESMLIGGQWLSSASGRTIDVEDPATGEIVATVPRAEVEDLERTISSAVDGFAAWRRVPGWERSERLREAAARIRDEREAIATLLTEEQGKPLAQSLAEVDTSVDQFEWYADEARRIYGRTVDAPTVGTRIEVRREPVGPVAAFTPWNFPVLLAARKLAPALAAGCSVILKPAEEAPSACLALVRAVAEVLPPGVVNAVTGDPAAVSEKLVRDRRIRKVSLTGSIRVGALLLRQAAETVTNVSMELGGHAPVVVWDDVDVPTVANQCVVAKFRNAGQVCVAPTRFIVKASIAEEFAAAFAAAADDIRVGDGRDPSTEMGPLASARRLDEVHRAVRDAILSGADLLAGGAPLEVDRGHFYRPTVLASVPRDAAIMSTEPFGPIALITAAEAVEDALELANSTEYGLAAYAFTSNLDRARVLSEGLEAGMVGINSFAVSTPVAPFSGIKMSGIGSENGTEAMDAYLTNKTVVTGHS